MDAQLIDRLLRCSDCQGEFIFTAGEQLFFQDKQFKNDPKRCKPCKSRRSGLAAAANGAGPAAAGLSRVETRTTCSECSVETTVPFKPTQGRPVLCRKCFQAKGRAPVVQPMAAVAVQTPVPLEMASTAMTAAATISALTQASSDANGSRLSAAEALVAAASMASASPESSVASAADLASILGQEATPPHTIATELVPAEVLMAAAAAQIPAELLAARVEAAEA